MDSSSLKGTLLYLLILLIGGVAINAWIKRPKTPATSSAPVTKPVRAVMGDRDKENNLCVFTLGRGKDHQAVWLKTEWGVCLSWDASSGGEYELFHRQSGTMRATDDIHEFASWIRELPFGSTLCYFTTCGGGFDYMMPQAEKDIFWNAVDQSPLLYLPLVGTICVCPSP